KAGNLKGQIVPGGNPFEAPRAREYALPPLTPIYSSVMFSEAAKNLGYHPFPRPSANASQAYTNPDGSHYGACQYCGYCQRFGCEANAKGSPRVAWLHRRLQRGWRLQLGAADRLPAGAARHAAMGQRVEGCDPEVVSGRDDHQLLR